MDWDIPYLMVVHVVNLDKDMVLGVIHSLHPLLIYGDPSSDKCTFMLLMQTIGHGMVLL